MSAAIDAVFEAQARAICEAKVAERALLRDFNESPLGATMDEILRRAEATDRRVEALRRHYFPRAHRLVIVDFRGYTVSKTGRSIRNVWTADSQI